MLLKLYLLECRFITTLSFHNADEKSYSITAAKSGLWLLTSFPFLYLYESGVSLFLLINCNLWQFSGISFQLIIFRKATDPVNSWSIKDTSSVDIKYKAVQVLNLNSISRKFSLQTYLEMETQVETQTKQSKSCKSRRKSCWTSGTGQFKTWYF